MAKKELNQVVIETYNKRIDLQMARLLGMVVLLFVFFLYTLQPVTITTKCEGEGSGELNVEMDDSYVYQVGKQPERSSEAFVDDVMIESVRLNCLFHIDGPWWLLMGVL